MIQTFFGSMITLMLVKFIMNDMSHAAGMNLSHSETVVKELSLAESFDMLSSSIRYYESIPLSGVQKRALSVLLEAADAARQLDEPYQSVLFMKDKAEHLRSFLVYYLSGYIPYAGATKEKVMEITYLASFDDKAGTPVMLRAVKIAKEQGVSRILAHPLDEEANLMYLKASFKEDPVLGILSRKLS